jgi:hypothetical protein
MLPPNAKDKLKLYGQMGKASIKTDVKELKGYRLKGKSRRARMQE